ncbi:unnamed protein product [Haemonchus placei]|uniref:Ephrin RBD domain-containing protein n=1 Tax=Haemonchus placei TaxID=6290 RepID=A0A0N4WGU6_HAEPC|nr:unnamed protein product [Haemonchus placei]
MIYISSEKVSEEEYTHCFLQNPHLVGSCNNNTQDVTITVVFRQFTPTPGGMEFEPGKTYHFITTSDGTLTGIDRRKDGLCTDRQMKIKFEVELPKHEIQKVNPKFAARTSQREVTAESSTPIMYIIHVDGEDTDELDDGEDTDELDDDQATTAFSSALPILLSLCLFYLI